MLETAGRVWDEPLEVHTALGHGRSYGRNTRVVGVGMPGIADCGLWRHLASARQMPTAALVTDIGNDLLYEEPVARIVGWLETCLDRLAAARRADHGHAACRWRTSSGFRRPSLS